MSYMTEPQNDGRNWCEPHRWAIMPALPLCHGRRERNLPQCIDCKARRSAYFPACDLANYDKMVGVDTACVHALLRVYARENHALRERVDELRDSADDAYRDGFDHGFGEANMGIRQEHKKLRARVDALEWMLECEALRVDLVDWHPYFMREAARLTDTALGVLTEISASIAAARAAVGVK